MIKKKISVHLSDSIAFVFRDTNYAVPKESELQYIEGVVEKYEPVRGEEIYIMNFP